MSRKCLDGALEPNSFWIESHRCIRPGFETQPLYEAQMTLGQI